MRKTLTRHWALLVLLTLGAAVRIYAAWCFAYSPSPDHGVASLMAKHMAEGSGFPMFFYGQAYLGSIEPMVCALFLKVMGVSGLAVNLGTAFLGFLLLPVVYLWGRDVAGRTAGLAAVAFCVVGPEYYFQYQSWGNGGYAATMLLGTTALWLAGRIAARHASGVAVRWPWFLALGIVGGLGWWTNQLIVAALGTAGLLLLIAMPRKLFTWRAVVGLLGFALGSAPFWAWNAANEWATFTWMSKMSGGVTFTEGLKHVITGRLPGLLAPQPAHAFVQNGTLALYAAVVAYLLWVLAVHIRGGRLRGRTLAVLCPLLFLVIFCVFYSSSSQVTNKTPRYGLPMIPVLGVVLGGAIANMKRVSRYGLRWLLLFALIVPHIWKVPEYADWRAEHIERQGRDRELIAFLDEQGIRSAYAPFGAHYLNFMFREKICFSDLFKERFLPYKVNLELADHIAVIDNNGSIHRFRKETQARARRTKVGGYNVYYNLAPPKLQAIPLEAKAVLSATDQEGASTGKVAMDGNYDTAWTATPSSDNPAWLDIELAEKTRIVGVRIVASDRKYPVEWEVQTLKADGWQRCSREMKMTHYYWSGTRPYWAFDFYRLVGRFAPVESDRIRIVFKSSLKNRGLALAEVQVLTASDEQAEVTEENLANLYRRIRDSGITDLYSDRWLANQVHTEFGGEVSTCRRIILTGPVAPLDTVLRFGNKTAVVVERREAAHCRSVLRNSGVAFRETQVGGLVMFDALVVPETEAELYWAGFSCLRNDPSLGQRNE